MVLNARKHVFGGLRTTKVQTSLSIRAVWSAAPLLFAYWNVSYLDLLQVNFCHDQAHMTADCWDMIGKMVESHIDSLYTGY